MVLPSDTVPHRPNTGANDTQALRDIFGISPTSHRGYQAATKGSGSFDAAFKFGPETPTKSRNKKRRSIDKFSHLRQHLSRSRLSNHSSGKSMKEIKSTETVVHSKLLPDSHTSAGLDDLLISRSVSEGGYDSDARGILTPSLTEASAGSVMVSPEYTAKVLDTFDSSPSKRSASLLPTPYNIAKMHHPPAGVARTSTARKSQKHHTREPLAEAPEPQVRVRSTSTPRKHVTPLRDSFSVLLQLQPQESPTDVLRRLSVGLANGTVKLPDTPELKAMRMPSIVEAMPEWRLSFAAPKRASSLHRGDTEVRQALKTLSERVERAKRDSVVSDRTSTDNHASLISNLDPTLLQYLSRYSDEEQRDRLHEATDEVDGGRKGGEAFREASDPDTIFHADTSGPPDSNCGQTEPAERLVNAASGEQHNQCGHESLRDEKDSVHLFDMRISQRLASTSVLPTTLPSSTNLGSNQHYMDRSSQSSAKLDRFPAITRRTSAESLRRPSDPRTRRLFEPDHPADGQRIQPKWRSGILGSSMNPDQSNQGAEVSRDDTSSIYMSDAGTGDVDVKSVASHRARSSSQAMSNSLAIAGRQGLLGIPIDQRRNSIGQMMRTHGQTQTKSSRSVSHTRGKESKFSEDFDVQQKKVGGNLQSEGANTLANESMSMLDFLATIDPKADGNGKMSEDEFVGALNERLRSSLQTQRKRNTAQHKDVLEASMSNGLSLGGNMNQFRSSNFSAIDEPTRTSLRGREECATNMWERALRMASEDPNLASSASLGSPFGRLRQDRSRFRRLSDSRPYHHHIPGGYNTIPARQSRSLSPDNAATTRPRQDSFNRGQHHSPCIEAKKPLTRSTSPARSMRTKKRSLLDISRFTTLGRQGNNNTAKDSPATATPTRDLLAWARFPSHTRLTRNGAAAENDGVSTRDFSLPSDTEEFSDRNRSKLSLMTQPANMGANTPGSWKFLRSGHGRTKSRSMNFPVPNLDQTKREPEKVKVKKKSSALVLTRSLAKWTGLYRNHSSDLRRLRAGHRSSVPKGGEVDFPELEIVPGFDGGAGGPGARVRMEQLGDFEELRRRWEEKGGRVKGEDPVKTGVTLAQAEAEVDERARRACVIKDDDNDLEDSLTGPKRNLLSSTDEFTVSIRTATGPHASAGSREGEDSYTSCSVDTSMSMSNDLLPPPRRLSPLGGTRPTGPTELESYCQRERENMMKRLVSSELRDSTTDFRMQLLEEERRVRERLLGGVEEG
ncbi:hypothetical protein EPUS_07000 [Endocarpon pusillum Z07020]|uniref:Uncharacterized protein n=1 Tax=Endocarpon pusillum (strain Z07020 / HMAS-L-300199) TaxID=1263415 RepID=U1GST0_ENDPU|nr:uncharacterized protein EPUS_07000 [Endocarpon pusillum Z07020]ERF75468.1 hypothetical protein EPUS_07000 [Endocarpon pusillum Z07020]